MKRQYRHGLIMLVLPFLVIVSLIGCSLAEIQPETQDATPQNSMHLKYWYDAPQVQEAVEAEVTRLRGVSEETRTIADGLFKVYKDDKGEYIISGSTQVYLTEGKIPKAAFDDLRLEGTSQRIYVEDDILAKNLKENVQAFYKLLENNQETQPANLTERLARYSSIAANLQEGLRAENPVYMNNLPTSLSVDSMTIDAALLMKHTSAFKVTSHDRNEVKFVIRNGAGEMEGTLVFDDKGVVQSAKIGDIEPDVSNSLTTYTYDIYELKLRIDIMDICDILGWDVEVYPNTGIINIVTDSKDLVVDNIIVANNDFMPIVNQSATTDKDVEWQNDIEFYKQQVSGITLEEAERHLEEVLRDSGYSSVEEALRDLWRSPLLPSAKREPAPSERLNRFNDKNGNGIMDYIEEGRDFDPILDCDPESDIYKQAVAAKEHSDKILKAIEEGRLDEFLKETRNSNSTRWSEYE